MSDGAVLALRRRGLVFGTAVGMADDPAGTALLVPSVQQFVGLTEAAVAGVTLTRAGSGTALPGMEPGSKTMPPKIIRRSRGEGDRLGSGLVLACRDVDVARFLPMIGVMQAVQIVILTSAPASAEEATVPPLRRPYPLQFRVRMTFLLPGSTKHFDWCQRHGCEVHQFEGFHI
jgi:hypothetical protein